MRRKKLAYCRPRQNQTIVKTPMPQASSGEAPTIEASNGEATIPEATNPEAATGEEEEDDCRVVGDEDADMIVDEQVNEENEEEEDEEDKEDEPVNENEVTDDGSGDDDAWNEQTIPDPLSSDTEEEEDDNQNVDPGELLALGKTFASANDCKIALMKYSLESRYDIKLEKSSAKRVVAICSDTEVECPWRVYCSYEKSKRQLQIKTFEPQHICVRSGYSKMLRTSTIAILWSERLRRNSKITKYEMAAEMKREYMLTVTPEQCGKAKTKLIKEMEASHEQHFSKVWDYQAEIFKKNHGSTMEIETIPGPFVGSKQRFFRLYVCFKAQKEAWKQTCRPIIGVDGAFLRWDIKGHLLAAVGRDGDNRIVPIAWAVVEVENDTNWEWFIRLLSIDLQLDVGKDIAMISDKHQSIVKAVKNVLPQAEHRMCCKHKLDNWKRDSHDMELQKLFWKIARSYTLGDYSENMKALEKYNPGAFQSLLRTNHESWSRAFYRIGLFCNDNLNNLCESFNRTIKKARRKPLLELLEDIRRQTMERTTKRSILANRLKTTFTKRAHDEIERVKKDSTRCVRYMATGNVYEIDDKGCGYSVDMGAKTCGCRKWQMTGIPCVHAACVIIAKKQKVDAYVSEFYTTQMWRKTYKESIRPVEGKKKWPETHRLGVLPPPWRLGNPGRQSNYARRKGANETSSSSKTKLSRAKRVISCSNCNSEGHNKLSCGLPPAENPPKRPRGRPRKNQGGTSQVQAQEPQSQQSPAYGPQSQQSQAHGSQSQQSQAR